MTNNTLESLLKQHHNEAYLWSLQCCYGHQDNAQDVLQLTYLKIIEGKAIYKNKSSFKTWLFAIIRFTAIDYHKKQEKLVSLDSIEISDHTTTFDERPKDYRLLLKKLPQQQQEVLTLAFYHNMTLQQIATIKELHIGTIRTHYERGKTSLRQLINAIAI